MVLTVLWTAACGPAPPVQEPVRFTVGRHDVALVEPVGWQHLDHGLEHRFQNGLLQISVADIGPVTRGGYLREIAHARKLYRNHRLEDAGAHLSSLPFKQEILSPRRWDAARAAWFLAVDGGRTKPVAFNEVEAAYQDLVEQVESLEPQTLAGLVERIMPSLFRGTHREVAEQHPVTISGRPGFRVETWDRLSHDHRRSFLLVLNDDNLLVVRMELGAYGEMEPVFEALVESLSLMPDQGSTGSTS